MPESLSAVECCTQWGRKEGPEEQMPSRLFTHSLSPTHSCSLSLSLSLHRLHTLSHVTHSPLLQHPRTQHSVQQMNTSQQCECVKVCPIVYTIGMGLFFFFGRVVLQPTRCGMRCKERTDSSFPSFLPTNNE